MNETNTAESAIADGQADGNTSRRRATLHARAMRVAQRIDLKAIGRGPRLATNPLTVEVTGGGHAVLFRFGVVVLFGVDAISEAGFLKGVENFVEGARVGPTEALEISVAPGASPSIEDARLVVPDLSVARSQVVADVLAKSLLLEDYERQIGDAFESVEPLAEGLRETGWRLANVGDPLRQIGEILLTQHQMVGRAEVGENPEILWEYPELERTFGILAREYEIKERLLALERKLDLLVSTAETLSDLLQNRRSLRVEWYIVILIVVEIVLTLYEMFVKPVLFH